MSGSSQIAVHSKQRRRGGDAAPAPIPLHRDIRRGHHRSAHEHITDEPGRQHHDRKGHAEDEQRQKGREREPHRHRPFERAPCHAPQRLHDDGEHRRLQPHEDCFQPGGIAECRIERRERDDQDEARQHEQQARCNAAAHAVQHPADIGRQLLGFGAGQQHAIVQRVQITVFRQPALFIDNNPMHQRNLTGRPPKGQKADTGERDDELAEPDLFPAKTRFRHILLAIRVQVSVGG